jgi:Rgg/GadR/MutR family transcriptional activator
MREAKHIPLYKAAGDILSAAQLSRFETGKSEINLTKFFALLENINALPEEFAYMLRNYDMDYNTKFFEQAFECEKNLDFTGMKILCRNALEKFKETGKASYKLDALYVKSILAIDEQGEPIDEAEKLYVVNFLGRAYEWGQYELHIFIGCCLQIDYQQTLLFAKQILMRTEFYQFIPANRELVCVMLKCVANRAIHEHDFETAAHYIDVFYKFAVEVWDAYMAKQEQRVYLSIIAEEQGDYSKAIEFLAPYIKSQEEFGINSPIARENKKALAEFREIVKQQAEQEALDQELKNMEEQFGEQASATESENSTSSVSQFA